MQKYKSFNEYIKEYPYCDYESYLDDKFKFETSSNKEEDSFVYSITSLAQKLKFSDQELANKFGVSLSTFQQWKSNFTLQLSNKRLPYPHIQKKVIDFINNANKKLFICTQCDQKCIQDEMNNDTTCKKCMGKNE